MVAKVAGIDVGSLYTKAIVMETDGTVLSSSILKSGVVYKGAAEAAFTEALKSGGLQASNISYIVSTGYGRARVPFANREVTEIACHARGAKLVAPSVHTVIDIGGQDSKVISINDGGQAINFVMNDKCAAGSGRFLEVMASALEVPIDGLSALAACSQTELQVSSVCTVFAESEVISALASGYDKADIALAIFRAIARRITGLVAQLQLKESVVMTGGVAKSPGMVKALEEKLAVSIIIPEEPQIIGALGAAIIAAESLTSLDADNHPV